VLHSRTAGRELWRKIAGRFKVRREAPSTRRETYFDTFDWRLYRAGRALSVSPVDGDRMLSWRSLDGAVLQRSRHHLAPTFATDLPEDGLRETLGPIIDVRKLLPVVEIELRDSAVRVLDSEDKTVVRVALVTGRASKPGNPDVSTVLQPRVRVSPVLGYDAAAADFVGFLETELGLRHADTAELAWLLAAIGESPAGYSSKIDLCLDSSMPVAEAVRQILATLLRTVQANEDGIRGNVDSEFLHDFRVAVRRARSCLGQLRDVLPPDGVDELRSQLEWLGKITGPMRDLDVYLLKIDGYQSSLPAAVRSDLAPLREFVERHHGEEQRRLRVELDSDRYLELTAAWRHVVEQTADGAPSRPVREVAVERIARCHARVLERGGAVGPKAPASKLHRLRIECKKLRYLLEFFRSLLDGEALDPVVEALKRLQDNLGDFNDLEIQQDKLRQFGREMAREGSAPVETLMTMGRLVERLEILQQRERKRFAKRFARFDDAENRERFRILLGAPPRTTP
jgi:CHAD domain-containing protein